MLSLNFYQNADAAVIKLLKYLSLKIDPEIVIAELEKHPDYPSLLAVSDVLASFNIENSAFRAEFNELIDLPCPFLVHARFHELGFAIVNEISNEGVTISDEKWDNHKVTAEEFKRRFTGVVLIAEVSSTSAEYPTKKTARKLFPASVAFIVLLGMLASSLFFDTSYTSALSWQVLLLTLFKTAGVVVSVLLLVQSIDSNNPLIQVLCQGGGKKDCNAILSSKAAKVFEGLSWSEVGFFYFAGTWLLLLFGDHSKPVMQVLAVLNVISLPYTFYSIYYQARIAKQWCVLCCTVQALLWLEFIPSITAFNSPFQLPGSREWNSIIIALLLPVVVWTILKPFFLKLQQLQPLKQQLRTFKYNTELFNNMLKDQPKYSVPDEDWSIILGNAEANHSITMVTNPYCPPCSSTHKLLDELLSQRDDIQARIVFTASNNDRDPKTPVSRHLMALNTLQDKSIVRKGLHDWYEQKQKDYQAWAKVYPVQLDEAEFYKIDKQKDWCEMAEVIATPTLLLNGYKLPAIYQLSDLKYMLE